MEEYVKITEFNELKKKVESHDAKFEDLTAMLAKIDKKVDIIGEKIDNSRELNDLKNQTIEAKIDQKTSPLDNRINALEKQVTEQKENSKWLWRTIIGSVIGIVIGAIVFAIQLQAK